MFIHRGEPGMSADVLERVRENFARQPFMNTLGASLLSVKPGVVEIGVTFRTDLKQQNGFLHSGVLTSVLDSACGYAALSVAPEGFDVLSVEFKVNLLTPAVGERFVARAQVKRAGKLLTVSTADAFAIKEGQEKLVATMTATIMNMQQEK
jgi:uncharacterized protein (TIGR00369 family)